MAKLAGALLIVLGVSLVLSDDTAQAATVKVTSDGATDPSTLVFEHDTCPNYVLSHDCDASGNSGLLFKEDEAVTMKVQDGALHASKASIQDELVVNAGQTDSETGMSLEMEVISELRRLKNKVESLEDEIAYLAGYTGAPRDSGGVVSCADMSDEKWAGAGLYQLRIQGVDTSVWCDDERWMLVLRGTNDGSTSNGDPTAYPVYPTGKPPSYVGSEFCFRALADPNYHVHSTAAKFNEPGVFRYDAATVQAMRDSRRVNDIKLVIRKGANFGSLGIIGTPVYFPKECVLSMDGRSDFLPSGDPCYTSGRDPDAATYDFIGGHQDKLLGRWDGPHVNVGSSSARNEANAPCIISYVYHMYPLNSVEGHNYCTWYDSRRCSAYSDLQIWVY